MNRYTIPHSSAQEVESGKAWEDAPVLHIASYPWDLTGYRPPTTAQAVWQEAGLHLRYQSTEKILLAEKRLIDPRVCDDSAVELFLMPAPQQSAAYVNLEFSALCAMYLGVGTGREDNVLLKDEDLLQFQVRSEIRLCEGGYLWTLQAFVPFAFLARHVADAGWKSGSVMRGNFYKLAETGPLEHCGSWNPIVWEEADFHRPEFFGELVLG